MSNEDKVLLDLSRNGDVIIRIVISEFKGKTNLNIREWYTDTTTGELKPTKKGVLIRPEELDEFVNAVTEAKVRLS